MKTYLFTFSLSMLLSIAITPVVIMLTHRHKLVDVPDVRKIHDKPIARLGGVAIFLSMICLIIPAMFLRNAIGESLRNIVPERIALLTGCAIMFIVGLVDDIKGTSSRYKLLGQLTAALLVCSFGIRIEAVNTGLFTLQLGWLSWPLTIFWIIGLTNAVNIIDGLDGLAAGICAIACSVLAILAIYTNQPIMAVLMLALLGSLVGFLFFNFSPARIFMGDCGSQFIGFCLAVSSVLCNTKSQALASLALPALALGIPIFDILLSMLRRFLTRRCISSPDRGHFHHRLLDLGFRHHHVVIIAYIVTAVVSGLSLFILATENAGSIAIFISCLLILLLVFRIVGSVRLRETLQAIRDRRELNRAKRTEQRNFDDVQLHFQNAETFDDWLQSVCLAADRMNFAWLSLTTDDEGIVYISVWRRGDYKPDLSRIVTMTIPVPIDFSGSQPHLKFAVIHDNSLESAGRRATLFGRLIDEHGPVPNKENKTNFLKSVNIKRADR